MQKIDTNIQKIVYIILIMHYKNEHKNIKDFVYIILNIHRKIGYGYWTFYFYNIKYKMQKWTIKLDFSYTILNIPSKNGKDIQDFIYVILYFQILVLNMFCDCKGFHKMRIASNAEIMGVS